MSEEIQIPYEVLPENFADKSFLADLFQDRVLGELIKLLMTMQPNDKLPSERELAERLNVSRTALRDRISKLASMGVITRHVRRGTIYTGLQPATVGDVLIIGLLASDMNISALVSVRHALERQAAWEIAQKADQVDFSQVEEALGQIISSDDGKVLLEADHQFHKALFKASNSSGLIFFWHALHTILKNTHQFVDLEEDRVQMRKLHSNVLDTVKSGDAQAAIVAMDEHFDWLHKLLNERGIS